MRKVFDTAKKPRRAVSLLLATLFSAAQAAPGTLPQTPLFLGFSVEPNIIFLIDDSGSMDVEVLTLDADDDGMFTGSQPDGSSPGGVIGSVKHRDSDDDGGANCTFTDDDWDGYVYVVEFAANHYGDGSNDCNTADDQAWRMRTSSFNLLYYDPSKTYEPWVGVDSAGNAFADVSVTAALENPYDPNSETIDLTRHNSDWRGGTTRDTSDRDSDGTPDGFRYYTWQDSNSNGLFDNDCNGMTTPGPGTSGGATCDTVTEYKVKDLSAADQANFANWFSYYRKREYVAKAAYGRVVSSVTDVRLGMMTLHDNNGVNTQIASLNGDVTSGATRTLLDAIYSIESGGGTPLRYALFRCGSYLECNSTYSPFGSACPALPATAGGACQQSFIIAMTDGYYNGSLNGLGNRDGDNNTSFDSGTNGPYGDSYSNTLADVAMYFYERDLQPGLDNEVPTIAGVDEASFQHAVTYTVGFGVNGTLTSMPPNDTDPFTWPSNTATLAGRIDDLRHAAYNGRGDYFSAYDADQLVAALLNLISGIINRTGSAASVTFNSGSLSTDSRVFLALFNSNRWNGQLSSYPLDGITGAVSATPDWAAHDLLDSRAPTSRVIYSHDGSDGIKFRWGQLSNAQKHDLCTGPETGADACLIDLNGTPLDPSDDIISNDAVGRARLSYIRGNRSNENGGYNFRVRGGRLGDIVHSGPVFVGVPDTWPADPPASWAGPEFADYDDFIVANETRTKVVYVGANDGMLHGFNAETGEEVLAYIPLNLFSTDTDAGLHYLTARDYVHRYYVDLEPAVSDAYIRTRPTNAQPQWRTVLIGGQRGGGRGYFALDVTDPSSFTEANAEDVVLWEFTSDDDPALGHSYSLPTVALMENGKWAAIFGNGYQDPADVGLDDGQAQLFIVYLEGGLDGVWTEGTDYVKISTGVGSALDRNGLASPGVIDNDGNGRVDRVYAGDLRGNLWVFDLSNGNDSSWSSAYLNGGAPEPLFTTDANQPITVEPTLTRHPTEPTGNANQPNVMAFFGTGQYLVDADKTSSYAQSAYGVWDRGASGLTSSDLVMQGIDSTLTSASFRVVTDNGVDYGNKDGWKFDLPAGERIVVNPTVRRGVMLFNTLIPSSAACDFGGSGWFMALDLATGGRAPDAPFDVNGDGKVDEDDLLSGGGNAVVSGRLYDIGIPAESAILGNVQYTPGTSTTTGATDTNSGSGNNNGIDTLTLAPFEDVLTGRLSWEELEN